MFKDCLPEKDRYGYSIITTSNQTQNCTTYPIKDVSSASRTTAGVKCLCGGCKMSPRTSSLCSHIFLVLRDH